MLHFFRKISDWFSGNDKRVVSIEISDTVVRLVIIERDEDAPVIGAAREEFIPEGEVTDGIVMDLETFIARIARLAKSYDFDHAVLVVPPTAVSSFAVHVSVTEKDIKAYVSRKIKEYIAPLQKNAGTKFVCEYELVASDGEHHTFQVVAVPHTRYATYTKIFKHAGVHLDSIEFAPLAIAKTHTGKNPYLNVRIGEHAVDTSIHHNNAVHNISVVPVGSHHVDRAIQSHLGGSRAEAKKIRKQYGFKGHHKDKQVLGKILETFHPVAQHLDNQARDWYKRPIAHKKEKQPIEKIVLHGDSADIPGLAEYLRYRTGLPVEHLELFSDDHFGEIPIIHKDDMGRYVSLLAVGMRR